MPNLKVGDITSNNWRVLDIQKYHNDRFISLKHYKMICTEDYKKKKKKDKLVKVIKSISKIFE